MHEALTQANVKLTEIGACCRHEFTGPRRRLLVGVSAAGMLALTLDVPLLNANHIEAHIFAARMAAGRDIFPCVGLVVSGGHTSLFHCKSPLDFDLLGGTVDDAAGEAFDKVAAILGLAFPAAQPSENAKAPERSKARVATFISQGRSARFRFSGEDGSALCAMGTAKRKVRGRTGAVPIWRRAFSKR